MATKYEEFPRSNFPEAIDNFSLMEDVGIDTKTLIEQYQSLYNVGNFTGIDALKEQYPVLDKLIFNADKYNNLTDAIKAIETYYQNDVNAMIETVAQHTVGINDAPTEDQKSTNTYSAKKVEEIIDTITNYQTASFEIAVDDWTTENGQLIYTYTDANIGENDATDFYFNDESFRVISKAQIRVASNTGAGMTKLIAGKTPIDVIKVDFIKVVKPNG